MIIVDAHQHYWDPARADYGWLDHAPPSLRQPFLPADLERHRAAAGVDACILVQAAPTEAETDYLFDLAAKDDRAVAVIGWIDMEAADASGHIDAMARRGGGLLRGIRPMAQDIADHGWLARPSLDRAFDCLREYDLAFEALVDGPRLPALMHRLEKHDARMVLDHAGKPEIGRGDFEAWASAMAKLADMPSLHCKLSGLLTQVDVDDGNAIEPYVDHLFACFGAKRLIWGSDWPVLTTHASYAHWLDLARALTRKNAPGHEADVFGGNAIRFYQLEPASFSSQDQGTMT